MSDYDFHLPNELIAQNPPSIRGESRLLVVDRATQRIEHRMFRDIVDYIPAGDVLVRNTTRVMRARLLGTRDSGAPAEVLLLKPVDAEKPNRYEAMVYPGSKLKVGRRVRFDSAERALLTGVQTGVQTGIQASAESSGDEFFATIVDVTDRGTRIVELHTTLPSINEAIEQFGHIPLPPYIDRDDTTFDSERYQTIYADQTQTGSVAAPTAGLHFTDSVLNALAAKNVQTANVTLHVGAGTFKPVDVDDPTKHVMHEEWYHLPAVAANTLNSARTRGAKIWAVGTTSVRTLESAVLEDTTFTDSSGETRIFIYPPYQWTAVDHLLTNFHLPRSTLIMLVAAFAGYDLTMRAYEAAVAHEYRFYSYGDAMLIL